MLPGPDAFKLAVDHLQHHGRHPVLALELVIGAEFDRPERCHQPTAFQCRTHIFCAQRFCTLQGIGRYQQGRGGGGTRRGRGNQAGREVGRRFVELEFNQDTFRLGHGGFGQNAPWQVVGSRTEGDVLVVLQFSGGALGTGSTSMWTGTSWMLLSDIFGESCDASENLCAVSNAEAIEGGDWSGDAIEAGRFVEIGMNIGALMPGAQPAFKTVRLRTPQDAAFGYFGEGS